MEEEKFDGLLMTLTQQAQGIDGLFKNFFGFLRRKTDYFSNQGTVEIFTMFDRRSAEHRIEALQGTTRDVPGRKKQRGKRTQGERRSQEEEREGNIREGEIGRNYSRTSKKSKSIIYRLKL